MNSQKKSIGMWSLVTSIAVALVLAFSLSACSNGSSSSDSSSSSSSSSTKNSSTSACEDPTTSKPITYDKETKTVKYLAEMNATYLTEDTRHGIVYEGGSNGDKSVLKGLGDEKEFYNIMMECGYTPGNNLTAEDMSATTGNGKTIEGDKLNVTIEWDGQDAFPISECFKATNGESYTSDWRFGGNIDRANAKNTGCVLCLDSCAVGICSDAAWPSNTTTATNTTWFNGVKDKLPSDGTKVIVTFTPKA